MLTPFISLPGILLRLRLRLLFGELAERMTLSLVPAGQDAPDDGVRLALPTILQGDRDDLSFLRPLGNAWREDLIHGHRALAVVKIGERNPDSLSVVASYQFPLKDPAGLEPDGDLPETARNRTRAARNCRGLSEGEDYGRSVQRRSSQKWSVQMAAWCVRSR